MKIVFDGTILVNILDKSASRSGVFFSIYNIFQELLKREQFEICLYCNDNFPEQVFLLNKVAEQFFPEYDLSVLNYTNLHDLYYKVWEIRKNYKKQKRYLSWIVETVKMIFLWGVIKTKSIFLSGKRFQCTEVYFTPFLRVPPYIHRMKRIRKYVYLHDVLPLLFPEYYPNVQKRTHWFPRLIRSLNKNDFYFTNSVSTKNDFIKYVDRVDASRYEVAYLACSEKFKQDKTHLTDILKKYGLPTDKKYVFSLCILDPRKNLIRAVRTFLQFIEKNHIEDMVYVLGGAQVDGFLELLQAELNRDTETDHKILRAGYIDDDDLAALYSGAEWFVYTSMYEGFGMPVLEAMKCGCPVIVSNNSSLPEVVGDAGILLNWESDTEHIAAYEKYYYDESYRLEKARQGMERAGLFTWKRTVDIITDRMMKDKKQEV